MTVAQWNHIHLVRLKIQATLSERCSAILKTPIYTKPHHYLATSESPTPSTPGPLSITQSPTMPTVDRSSPVSASSVLDSFPPSTQHSVTPSSVQSISRPFVVPTPSSASMQISTPASESISLLSVRFLPFLSQFYQVPLPDVLYKVYSVIASSTPTLTSMIEQ